MQHADGQVEALADSATPRQIRVIFLEGLEWGCVFHWWCQGSMCTVADKGLTQYNFLMHLSQ